MTTNQLEANPSDGLIETAGLVYHSLNTTATLSACKGNAQPWRFFYARHLVFVGVVRV